MAATLEQLDIAFRVLLQQTMLLQYRLCIAEGMDILKAKTLAMTYATKTFKALYSVPESDDLPDAMMASIQKMLEDRIIEIDEIRYKGGAEA